MDNIITEMAVLTEDDFSLSEAFIFVMLMEHHNPDLDEKLALQIMDLIRQHVANRKYNEK